MTVLGIDIETYSSIDLQKCGVYAYTSAPDFEVLLFGYAFGDCSPEVVDLACGQDIPIEVMDALTSSSVLKTAFNANFERVCLSKFLKQEMPPEQWHCSSVHALMLGLPSSLEKVAECLKLHERKMGEGKALIRYFCVPCRPTKANGGRTRNLPQHDRKKWETFKEYCRQDVEAERSVRKVLARYPVPPFERRLWFLDQKINDAGVRVDKELVTHAIKCDSLYRKKLEEEAASLTGIDNPNSPAQMKEWLRKSEGIKVKSLSKEAVAAIKSETESEKARRVLELRQEMSKTSIRKYEAMLRSQCGDIRIRGLLQFYGASRTGRWAGRLVQVHNLPRNNMKNLDTARELLKEGRCESLEVLFDSVPDVLSQLIRTAFIPSVGHRFIVADFSAIEARIISWLAGEEWRMDVFRSHGKIYEACASRMFDVPVESITKTSPLRQKGKIAELALGYQGSVGALKAMGAIKMGLSEDDLQGLVTAWRRSNPKIVRLWYELEEAAVRAVIDRCSVCIQHGLGFFYEPGVLFARLPSGRCLAYTRPEIERDKRFGRFMLTYEGTKQGSRQWGRLKTYGGKLAENITQAAARDCLAESLVRLDKAGYKTVMHIHDEVVLDVPFSYGSSDEVEEIMSRQVSWAPGLPLKAEAFETDYYKKE